MLQLSDEQTMQYRDVTGMVFNLCMNVCVCVITVGLNNIIELEYEVFTRVFTTKKLKKIHL